MSTHFFLMQTQQDLSASAKVYPTDEALLAAHNDFSRRGRRLDARLFVEMPRTEFRGHIRNVD